MSSPEKSLLYADTIIVDIKWQGAACTIRYEDWDGDINSLAFLDARIISECEIDRDRVEKGTLKHLSSGNWQLTLVDDDDLAFLVLEYRNCEPI